MFDDAIAKGTAEDEVARVVGNARLRRLSWRETDATQWLGLPPRVTIEFDDTNRFLLHVQLRCDSFGYSASPSEELARVRDTFYEVLVARKVLAEAPSAPPAPRAERDAS